MDGASAEYLTPQQLASLLQVSVRTIYRLADADPTMPVLRLTGGTMRFPAQRLEHWLRQREQGRPQSRLGIVKAEAAG